MPSAARAWWPSMSSRCTERGSWPSWLRRRQMLFGTLVNRSAGSLKLRAADVRVLDRNGHALEAAAAFAGGYNAGIALRGFGTEMFAAATVGTSDGDQATLAPKATVPLSVSWKGEAAVVEVAGAQLKLH